MTEPTSQRSPSRLRPAQHSPTLDAAANLNSPMRVRARKVGSLPSCTRWYLFNADDESTGPISLSFRTRTRAWAYAVAEGYEVAR